MLGARCTVPLTLYDMDPCGFERGVDAVPCLQIHLLRRPFGNQGYQREATVQLNAGQRAEQDNTGYLAIEGIPGAGRFLRPR